MSRHLTFILAFLLLFSTAFAAPSRIAAIYCALLIQPTTPGLLERLEAKSKWRQADTSATLERRVKMRTNLERRAGQRGGMDESADPASPFILGVNDPRPAGMPPGVYWSNSGQYFYRSKSISSGLHGGPRATERFEFVFLHKTADGRVVQQRGGYASPDSSWGWDGRFEFQPDGRGGYELVVTQGAMELPSNMRGAQPGAKDLPEIALHNPSRSRHVFKPMKFENGKLYLMDQGSILENRPDINGDWISYQTVKGPDGKDIHVLTSAHGYGENYIPLASDPRKMWTDEFGYPIRIFDMVTREVHIEREVNGRMILVKEPATTRSIAYRMDPKNPSKRVPQGTLLPNGKRADEGIVVMSEELPSVPGKPMPSTARMKDLKNGKIIEVRTVNMDGTVTVERNFPNHPSGAVDNLGNPDITATLIEGFNPAPGVITLPSGKQFYIGTFSASEYTAGALPAEGKKLWRYGSYIGFRSASDGPLGRYQPVTEMTERGEDLADALEDFTELYGLSWGAGRPQAYQDEAGRWWLDVHFVDTDLLPAGLPKSGYPASHKDFADAYRRHKASFPIRWTEKNGMPWFEIDDPVVHAEVQKYRASKKILH